MVSILACGLSVESRQDILWTLQAAWSASKRFSKLRLLSQGSVKVLQPYTWLSAWARCCIIKPSQQLLFSCYYSMVLCRMKGIHSQLWQFSWQVSCLHEQQRKLLQCMQQLAASASMPSHLVAQSIWQAQNKITGTIMAALPCTWQLHMGLLKLRQHCCCQERQCVQHSLGKELVALLRKCQAWTCSRYSHYIQKSRCI